jgi:hypothetical protein
MAKNNIDSKTKSLIGNDAPLKSIYQLKCGTQVGMVKQRDGNLRCSVGIVVISPEGQISDMVNLKRSTIITGKSAFNFLYDFEAFDKKDIEVVSKIVLEELGNGSKHTTYSRSFVSWEEMYQLIVDYAIKNKVPDTIETNNDYIYIGTEAFDQMLTEICAEKFIECKKKELLNLFLACGILQPNKNVPYLYKKKKSTEEGYVYVYRLKRIDKLSILEEEA